MNAFQTYHQKRCFPLASGVLFCLLMFMHSSPAAQAANWARLLDEFAGTSKAAKGTVESAEDTSKIARRSSTATEAVAREARYMGVDAANKPLLRQALTKTLRQQGGDPAVLRFVDDLADADVDIAVVFLRGGRRLKETVPDIAARAHITQQGGSSALASLGLRDSVLAEDFLKLDALAMAGKVPAQIAGKSTLSRLGELFSDGSDRFATFYSNYIRGNEGKWVGGGALAWWLTDPDSFQDTAGKLTEAGFQKASELGGEVLAAALRGIAEGGKEAGEKMVTAAAEGFLAGPYAWAAWLALLVFLYLAGLALPITRRFFLKPVKALFRPHA
jgi:hypothetical protein